MKAGWEIKKLGEVCDIFTGQGAPQGESNYGTEGVPFIKAGNLEDLINGLPESMIQHVSDEVAKKHKLKLYESNSIVFAKSGMSCMKGHIYTLKGDCYVVSHLAILTPRKIVSSFLNYVLRFHRPNSLIKDSAYPSISLEDIKSFSIPIPPLLEQERIVSELDLISGVIEKKKQQLKELDSLAQSVFYEMFGNPVENEKGWEVKKLGDCFYHIKNGANIKQERGAQGIPITRIETLSGGVFNRDRLGYANVQSADKYASYILESGDLLLSHINSKTYIGRTVVYNKVGEEIIIHGMNLLRLKSYSEIIHPLYMQFYSFTDSFKIQIANRRKDAVNQSSISITDLKTISITIPPLSLQQEFASMIESIERQKELIKQSLKDTETLFDSRMDYYFN